MVRQGYVRPLVLMVIGWYMGTRQMIKKHTDDVDSATMLLHPAYCFYYTMYAGAVFVLVYQEWDRRQGEPDPAVKCSDYFYDTYDKFGFIVDSFENDDSVIFRANNFFFRMVAAFLAQMVVAFGFAWNLRRRSAKVKDIKTFRVWMFRYSITALAVGVGAFLLLTLVTPKDEEDPSAAGAVPCAFDPASMAPPA